MAKILVSISALPPAASSKPKVSGDDVKNAKSILKAASKQAAREHTSTYKQAVKHLAALRKKREREVGKVSKQVENFKAKLDRINEAFDSRISRVTAQRDKAAQKAGIIIEPKALVSRPNTGKVDPHTKSVIKKPSSKPKEEPDDDDADTEEDTHNVKLPSKHKDVEKAAPAPSDESKERDTEPRVPTKVKPTSPVAPVSKDKAAASKPAVAPAKTAPSPKPTSKE